MEKVTTILAKKQPYFNTVPSTTAVSDALHRMSCENADFLIVMDNEHFVGLLTEHDITSKAMQGTRPLSKMQVKEMMNTRLPIIASEDTLERCMKLMRLFKVHYLPVFENFRFCGIVSSDDILQEAVNNRERIFDEGREPEEISRVY